MAKVKQVATIDVSGLSIEDIMNMNPEDINRLNTKDMKRITSRLVSASNKRIRRLAKTETGRLSPAYQQIMKKGGKQFSVKGKTLGQVRNTFAQAKKFLNYKTSTMTGWKKTKKEIEERVGVMTNDQSKKMWELYRKAQESQGGVINYIGDSLRIQKMIRDEVVEHDDESIEDRIMKKLDDEYTKLMRDEIRTLEDDEITDVFDFEYDFFS